MGAVVGARVTVVAAVVALAYVVIVCEGSSGVLQFCCRSAVRLLGHLEDTAVGSPLQMIHLKSVGLTLFMIVVCCA